MRVCLLLVLVLQFVYFDNVLLTSSCDTSVDVCLVGEELSFPPASGRPSNVDLETEPDNGGLTVYLQDIVGGFYKFAFPSGLPWNGIGAMLQTFLGNNGPNGDPSLADKKDDAGYLLDETLQLFSDNYGNYVIFSLIVIFSLLFVLCCPLVSCIFCICRCCCNKCGAQKKQPKPTTTCFVILLVGTSLGVILSVVGGSLLAATNSEVAEDVPSKAFEFSKASISTLTSWINNVIDDLYDASVIPFHNVTDIVTDNMNSAGEQIFQPIIDWMNSSLSTEFSDVDQAIEDYNTASAVISTTYNEIYYNLSTSSQNMRQISDALSSIHTALTSDVTCSGDGSCSTVASEIAKHIINDATYTATYTEVNITDPEIASGFNGSSLLTDALVRAGADLNTMVQSQLDTMAQEMKDVVGNITKILDDARTEITDTIDKTGLDSIEFLDDLQGEVEEYESLRKGVGSLPMVPAVLIFIIVTVGVVLGLIGYDKYAKPEERSNLSNTGGKVVCYGAVCSFLCVWFYMVGFVFPFLFFSMPVMICEGLKSDEIITDILDREYFFDGKNAFYIADLVLGNGSVSLTFGSVLDDCRNGLPVWSSFRVSESTSYDLNSWFNVSNLVQNSSTEFDDASGFNFSSFNFIDGDFQSDIDQIQTDVATFQTNLDNFKTFVDNTVGVYYRQLSTTQGSSPTGIVGTPCQDSASDCDSLEDILTALQAVSVTSTAITNAETSLSTVITNRDIMNSNKTTMDTAVDDAKVALSNISDNTAVLETAVTSAESDLNNNGSEWMVENAELYANKLSDWFQDTFDRILDVFSNTVGECESFVAIYDAMIVNMCDYFLLELSGLFFASGLVAVGLIFLMICGTRLSKYLKRMDSNGSVHPANDYESEFTVATDDGLKDPPPPPPLVETAVRPRVYIMDHKVLPVVLPAPVVASAPPPPASSAPRPPGYQWDAKKEWEP
ncbi:prominin-1-like isoform X2 [Convolutriloba macropyga]|uniref:prominin-1-like isoform X2 n=1 Tax=Convolutriloba macropyga TaxID=536237 RepID=UPI003F51AF0B